jgi:hypothetical protein
MMESAATMPFTICFCNSGCCWSNECVCAMCQRKGLPVTADAGGYGVCDEPVFDDGHAFGCLETQRNCVGFPPFSLPLLSLALHIYGARFCVRLFRQCRWMGRCAFVFHAVIGGCFVCLSFTSPWAPGHYFRAGEANPAISTMLLWGR